MRNLFITLLLCSAVAFSSSCSKPKSETTDSPKSAGEIIDTYVETLSKAPDKARNAADLVDKHNEEELKALEAIDADR